MEREERRGEERRGEERRGEERRGEERRGEERRGEERRGEERSVLNHVTRAVFSLSVDTVRLLQVNLPCTMMTWTVP